MSENARVLVIDDDAIVGKSFDRVLSGKGYNITTAVSGEQGLEDIDSNEDYDVVFTDIVMPGIDGIEVAQNIRERCPWTPVVVITGYGSKENEERASVLGVDGFVRKPLTPDIIESVTLKAVQHRAELLDLKESANEVEEEVTVQSRSPLVIAKHIGMFLAAPFIALGYILALPIVGMYQFSKLAIEAYRLRG
jgi:CheY-like chemotaxis protein